MVLGTEHTTSVLVSLRVKFMLRLAGPLVTLNVMLTLLEVEHTLADEGPTIATVSDAVALIEMVRVCRLLQVAGPTVDCSVSVAPAAGQPSAGGWQVTTNVVLVGTADRQQ